MSSVGGGLLGHVLNYQEPVPAWPVQAQIRTETCNTDAVSAREIENISGV